jgi:hypothetical protein
MDTDSAYMALSAGSLEEVIKPEMQQRYQMEKKKWFPRTDTPQLTAYDKRTELGVLVDKTANLQG